MYSSAQILQLQGSLEVSREGVAFEHGAEEDNGAVAWGEDMLGIGHLVGGPTERFKEGEDLIGEILGHGNGRSHGWGQGRAGVMSIEEPEDLSLCSASCWPGMLSFPFEYKFSGLFCERQEGTQL